LEESVEVGPAAERWLVTASGLAYRSLTAGDRGQLDEQLRFAQAAAEVADDHGLEQIRGEVHVAMGAALEAHGRPEEGLPHLERGVAVLCSRGQPLDFAMALIRYGAALRAKGWWAAARAVITKARTTIDSCPDPGMLAHKLEPLDRSTRRGGRGSALSERELVVLRMLKGPLSERDIGRELYLSYNTIHSHTRSIYRKLGVSSRKQAVLRALEL